MRNGEAGKQCVPLPVSRLPTYLYGRLESQTYRARGTGKRSSASEMPHESLWEALTVDPRDPRRRRLRTACLAAWVAVLSCVAGYAGNPRDQLILTSLVGVSAVLSTLPSASKKLVQSLPNSDRYLLPGLREPRGPSEYLSEDQSSEHGPDRQPLGRAARLCSR